MANRQQLEIDFEVGLNARYPSIMDVIRAAVERQVDAGKQKKLIAAECEMTPQEFARRLGDNDDLPFRLEDLPYLLAALPASRSLVTDWLIEGFVEDPGNKQQRAADLVLQLAPALLEAANILKKEKSLTDDAPPSASAMTTGVSRFGGTS